MTKHLIPILVLIVTLCSCGGNKSAATDSVTDSVALVGPTFSEDSAYAYCAAQCAFGPRTMNSPAHEQCKEWIAATFRRFGMDVIMQTATLNGYDGTPLKATNIIAQYNPAAEKRILFCAHWDARPWADNDPIEANHKTPIDAANDGASGVAVMLELARLLQKDSLDYGVDFICFDAEDWGTPQ
ncbi:MAG: M28 family peptidase, partial [Bacteroidaceae bacterium]|nr:M28 family peptidase [Bacteroidaceae bacterium]